MKKWEERANEETTEEGDPTEGRMEEAESGSVGPERGHNPMYSHQEIFSIPSGKE
jgi:hypothetical protein